MAMVMAAGGALSFLLAMWGLALVRGGERVAPSALARRPRRTGRRGGTAMLVALAALVGRPFTARTLELLRPWHPALRRRIDAAGRPGGMTVETYARVTAGFVMMFGPLGLLAIADGQLLMGVLLLAGTLQNELTLYGRIARRRDEIERTLPDFLDVLAVTVSAGLSFRHSLARVAESMPGVLAEEFFIALRQMDLGTPRREAFEDLRRRNRSEMLGQFVTAILQAEELGAPLAPALMDIAKDMRRAAAQWARRKAQRTTPKITLVTTVMALPAVLLIMMGALVLNSGADFGAAFNR
jgi:tight adherence protein C